MDNYTPEQYRAIADQIGGDSARLMRAHADKIEECERLNASRAALLADHDVAGLVKWLRSQYDRQGMIGHSTAADALESLAYQLTLFKAENAMLAAQVAERDAEIERLKMENSKLRSALEIVHFKREPWQ